MLQASFGIFSCQNVYNCIESVFLAILSIATLILFIRAYFLIRKDQAQILDSTDKIIFSLASIHSGVLSFTFLLFTNPFFVYSIRALDLILDIIIWSVVAYMYFSKDVHSRIDKCSWLAFMWTLLLWFYSVLSEKNLTSQNECGTFNLLLFSGTAVGVGLMLLFCGCGSIRIINDVERRQSVYSSDDEHNLWQIRRFQELNERRVQIQTLTIVNTIAPLIELLWDLKKYDLNYTVEECDKYTFAHGWIDLVIFIVAEVLCNLLPSWGIYYLYYWRNREHFRPTLANFNKHLNDFDELRSDMIELV